MSSRPDLSVAGVEARERTALLGTYAKTPFHPRRGRGARLFDAREKPYWDLLGGLGVNVLGHRHPALVRALRQSASELLHVSNLYYHPAQGLLAERLLARSGLSRVFFCNSGTEANEAALKLSRLARPGRTRLVALEGGFHGRTFGSLSITGKAAYREPFAPLVGGEIAFVPPDDVAALEGAAGTDTAAIILEPILGEGGVIPLSSEFLRAARATADRCGALLVLDEIQCGLGRTGDWFAFQEAGIAPDILTLAKSLGGGLPLGAVVSGSRLDDVIRPGQHGTTFGGNPVACRLGIAVIDAIEEKGLLRRVRKLGEWLEGRLGRLAGSHGVVEVRGKGLMWGIELDRPAGPVAAALLTKGFVTGSAGERVLRILPPYVIPRKALHQFCQALESTLSEVSS